MEQDINLSFSNWGVLNSAPYFFLSLSLSKYSMFLTRVLKRKIKNNELLNFVIFTRDHPCLQDSKSSLIRHRIQIDCWPNHIKSLI